MEATSGLLPLMYFLLRKQVKGQNQRLKGKSSGAQSGFNVAEKLVTNADDFLFSLT